MGVNTLTSEVFVVFCKDDVAGSKRFVKSCGRNLVIGSKIVTEALIKELGLPRDEYGNVYEYIKISEDLSRTEDQMTFKLFHYQGKQ